MFYLNTLTLFIYTFILTIFEVVQFVTC